MWGGGGWTPSSASHRLLTLLSTCSIWSQLQHIWDAEITTLVFPLMPSWCKISTLYYNPSWMVIDCREGKVHWGFLSLIKILLDCCSHMWPNYFFRAKKKKKRPTISIQTHTWKCGFPLGTVKIKLKCLYVHTHMQTPTHAFRHGYEWGLMQEWAFMQGHGCTCTCS